MASLALPRRLGAAVALVTSFIVGASSILAPQARAQGTLELAEVYGSPGILDSISFVTRQATMFDPDGAGPRPSMLVFGVGNFARVGGLPGGHVFTWDGERYAKLDAGITSGRVLMFAVAGGELYGAGGVGLDGAPLAQCVIRWTGTRWQEVSAGRFNGSMLALAVWNGQLVVGGNFTQAGSTPAQGLVQLQQGVWVPLAQGPAPVTINAITSDAEGLAVGGVFTSINGVDAVNVARLEPAGWRALGAGITTTVNALIVHQGQLHAGLASGTPPVQVWNGTTWQPNGLVARGAVSSLASVGNDLFVSGSLTVFPPPPPFPDAQVVRLSAAGTQLILSWNTENSILADQSSVYCLSLVNNVATGGATVWRISRWDNTTETLHTVGAPAPARFSGNNPSSDINLVETLKNVAGTTYATGFFRQVGDAPAFHTAKYDNRTWTAVPFPAPTVALSSSFAAVVHDAIAYQGDVVFCGSFNTRTAGFGRSIIAWNGTDWRGFGVGIEGVGLTMAVLGDDLIVAGRITSAGGTPVNNVARWNGTAWEAMGDGFNNFVSNLIVFQDQLYAMGIFTQSGSTPLPQSVARWNGTAWESLGTRRALNLPNSATFEPVIFQGKLYIGWNGDGQGDSTTVLARWDGASWSTVRVPTTQPFAWAITVHDNKLVVRVAGSSTVPDNILLYDGQAWESLPGFAQNFGRGFPVSAAASLGDDLWIGGRTGISTISSHPWLAKYRTVTPRGVILPTRGQRSHGVKHDEVPR